MYFCVELFPNYSIVMLFVLFVTFWSLKNVLEISKQTLSALITNIGTGNASSNLALSDFLATFKLNQACIPYH